MGIVYFPTLVEDFLFSTITDFNHVNLANKNVIIDGNSYLHHCYDQVRMEDSSKSMAQRVTATQFGYDGWRAKFRDGLKEFKDKCASVRVVFDGFFKPNSHLRPKPERASSVWLDDENGGPPSLIREELMHILRELEISVHVAPGEADPVIVRMAREHKAYIVARDVDYYLYDLSQGYVPLSHLKIETLVGRVHQMTDVFHGLNQKSVALWATIIAFDFVDFSVLEDFFSTITLTTKDKRKFRKWLKDIDSDEEKRQWLSCQWDLLRYIQQVSEQEAFDKLIQLISVEHQPLFHQLIESYVTASNETPIRTRNNNTIHPYLYSLYVKGELARDVVRILVTGEVLPRWQGTHIAHLQLLLPMRHILLKWDYQENEVAFRNAIVTFKDREYRPFELFQSETLPLLVEFAHRGKKERKSFVLGCVDFALKPVDFVLEPVDFTLKPVDFVLKPGSSINWRGIQNNYLLWLSLLKLWFHTREITMPLREPILCALIVSFLKHVLLDTYDETEERARKDPQAPSEDLLQYSTQYLKTYFSLAHCKDLRESIEQHPTNLLANDDIEMQLVEVEQFYKELTMINQLCGQAFNMPPPHHCVSQLTRQLAVVFKLSKNIWQDIQILFVKDETLMKLTEEIYNLIKL